MPYEFWEILRGVTGAGVDGFVYHLALVRSPTPASRKVPRTRGGKSPRTQPSLRDRIVQDQELKKENKEVELEPAPTSEEEEKDTADGKRKKEKKV